MSGRWVRRIEDRTDRRCECRPPKHARTGEIWQCDCGRRYTCVDHVTEHGRMVTLEANWQRRYWPWPRLDPVIPIGGDTSVMQALGIDASDVDRLANGPRDRSGAREVRKQ